jgi:hypothetical protein
VLKELAEAPLADQAWLRALCAFGELHRRDSFVRGRAGRSPMRPVALLLFGSAANTNHG